MQLNSDYLQQSRTQLEFQANSELEKGCKQFEKLLKSIADYAWTKRALKSQKSIFKECTKLNLNIVVKGQTGCLTIDTDRRRTDKNS